MQKLLACVGLLLTACSSASPEAVTDASSPTPPASSSSTSPTPASSTAVVAGAGASGSASARDAGVPSDAATRSSASDAGDAEGGGGNVGDPPAGFTVTGVPVPSGFTRVISDRFGTGPGQNVGTYAALHAKYYEGQYYNRDGNGLVLIPNVSINGEQETYSHFETAVMFAADHLTIQARGQSDGSISSGEMVSVYTARSWCVEAKYQLPATDKSWPALWWYAATANGDSSEIDIEQPVTPNQGVHDMSLHNHPYEYDTINIVDHDFTTQYMTWTNPQFDSSASPHVYTTCYDDGAATLGRWLDGKEIYSAAWKWNKSLGGTGQGPGATTILNLAVGGNWPGNTADPAHYSADMNIYYVDYYAASAK